MEKLCTASVGEGVKDVVNKLPGDVDACRGLRPPEKGVGVDFAEKISILSEEDVYAAVVEL